MLLLWFQHPLLLNDSLPRNLDLCPATVLVLIFLDVSLIAERRLVTELRSPPELR